MKIEFDEVKTAQAIPGAAAMIETFRAIGYTLETAVADIVDNSISASAKNVWLNRIWKGVDSVITIMDDGHGMTGDEIIQAMRPGAQNPLEKRAATDLGRFGLGLKTASFSQCRTLTVMSKIQGQSPEFWTWSLDHVARSDRWELKVLSMNWMVLHPVPLLSGQIRIGLYRLQQKSRTNMQNESFLKLSIGLRSIFQ